MPWNVPERGANVAPVCSKWMFSAVTPIGRNRRHASEGNCKGSRALRHLTHIKRLVEFWNPSRSGDLSVACGKEQCLLGRHAEDKSDAIGTGILCSRFIFMTSFGEVIVRRRSTDPLRAEVRNLLRAPINAPQPTFDNSSRQSCRNRGVGYGLREHDGTFTIARTRSVRRRASADQTRLLEIKRRRFVMGGRVIGDKPDRRVGASHDVCPCPAGGVAFGRIPRPRPSFPPDPGSPDTACIPTWRPRGPIAAPGAPPDIIAIISRAARRLLPGATSGAGTAIEETANGSFCVLHDGAAGRRTCSGACPVRFAAGAAGLCDEPACRQPAAAADTAKLSQRLAADAARPGAAKPVGAEPRPDRRDASVEYR